MTSKRFAIAMSAFEPVVQVLSCYLVKESNVKREPELVSERNLVSQLIAQLSGGCGGVSIQSVGVAVHESNRHCHSFFSFGCLRKKPTIKN